MSDSGTSWPLDYLPDAGTRIILASQGPRIWTTDCSLKSSGETLYLTGADRTTVENLKHQHRVAFTIITDGIPVQGNGMARLKDFGPDILLEPYRLSYKGETLELKLNGWTRVGEEPPPDIRRFSFWYQAFRLITLPLSALPVLLGGASAFALGQVNLWLLVLALIGAVAAHAGANAVADYFDFKRGVDLSKALSSHLGMLAQERIEPELILMAAWPVSWSRLLPVWCCCK